MLAACSRLAPVENAVSEVAHLTSKPLLRGELWNVHISSPILNQDIIDGPARGNFDSFVVDFNFFVGLEVIIYDHPLRASYKRSPHLHWTQPVHVDMRQDPARHFEGQVSHSGKIFVCVPDMTCADGRNGRWPVTEDIKKDGQVVRG